jgi:hypothetical protein
MESFSIYFASSGITTYFFLPPLVAFCVSIFTSMAGLSGAVLLLPFQMSYLGFTSPAVSSTNLVYNIVAIPSGAYRYAREGRLAWPLAWIIIAGTLPGVFIGYYLRVWVLPDPAAFKLFVGCVLLYISVRLLYESWFSFRDRRRGREGLDRAGQTGIAGKTRNEMPPHINSSGGMRIEGAKLRLSKVEYSFQGQTFSFSTLGMFLLSLFAGLIGGAYGVGGAALIAPFCVFLFGLPIHTIAGAAMVGAFFTSVVGVFFYSVIPTGTRLSCAPDWPLGILFGLGGFAGTYCGARLQKFVPPMVLKVVLGVIIFLLSASYILQYFSD